MNRIGIFIFDGMTDYEVTFVSHLLSTSGNMEVISCAYEDKLIRGKSGLLYKPQTKLSEVVNEDLDGLIITGGWNGDIRQELLELIRNLNLAGKLIGGICGAGTIYLAKSGILDNVKYTTPAYEWTEKHKEVFGEEDPFIRENFLKNPVVRDRNIITAQGTAFIDFGIEICDFLNLFENNEEKNQFAKLMKCV